MNWRKAVGGGAVAGALAAAAIGGGATLAVAGPSPARAVTRPSPARIVAPRATPALPARASQRAMQSLQAAQTRDGLDTIHWSRCSYAHAFQCGRLRVPLDYEHPDGPKISLALIRHPAASEHPLGTVFMNPGGPGGAGTTGLVLFEPFFPAAVRARFDIVSFDPRGVGASDPLRCAPTAYEDYKTAERVPEGYPVGAAQTALWLRTTEQIDRNCARYGGPIQYHMGTADVARDMDRIRAAMGLQTIDYWSPSYGSYLGATYLNMFPTHALHFILDGNVPPGPWNDARLGAREGVLTRLRSAAGAEIGFRMMIDDCGRVTSSRCAFSAGSPAATLAKYETLRGRLARTPVVIQGGRVTAPVLAATVAHALETEQPVTGPTGQQFAIGWSGLAESLQEIWVATETPQTSQKLARTAVLPPVAVPGAPLSWPEGNAGVFCSDSPNPTDAASWPGQARLADADQAPDGFGAVWAWFDEVCAGWHAHAADRYTGPWTRARNPVLVIGTLGDTNTPYVDSVLMAHELGHQARLLTETGGGHSALLNPSRCIDAAATRFLLSGVLPRRGTVCNQNLPPF